ncbi:hypothetical protein EHYA_00845 [Embleya hyalina]|uniref:Uncharacterized protein n=1 Tax=Embleya hyalina TaxID=516124 RepID=A0A401YF28_9ACTN|nr:hypothetical protein EHYA_00845 [Embleya hyalina]
MSFAAADPAVKVPDARSLPASLGAPGIAVATEAGA